MLKGLADVHVVFALVQSLRRRGMDVVTAQERGLQEADDADLLVDALRDERVLLTNDQDFLVLGAEYSARGETFAPIYYWPQQQRTIGELLRKIVQLASQGDYASMCSLVYFF